MLSDHVIEVDDKMYETAGTEQDESPPKRYKYVPNMSTPDSAAPLSMRNIAFDVRSENITDNIYSE